MSDYTAIVLGHADQVGVELVRGYNYRRWVTTFRLNGSQMYFVNNVDVSFFARNYPKPFGDGDEIIGLAGKTSFPFISQMPSTGRYQEVLVVCNVSSGKMFGSNGRAFLTIGGLAAVTGVGLLAGLTSTGATSVLAHMHLLAWAVGLSLFGAMFMVKGVRNRRNWSTVEGTWRPSTARNSSAPATP